MKTRAMKTLGAAAVAALLAAGNAAAAQPYPQPYPAYPQPAAPEWYAANPYDGPAHYAPDNGPQYRWMMTHGYTVNDAMPPNGGDGYSEALNAEEADHPRWHIVYPAPRPEDY